MPRIISVNDSALTVELGDVVDDRVNQRVIDLARSLVTTPLLGVVETVPTYRSLLVVYDPSEVRFGELSANLQRRLHKLDAGEATGLPNRLWRVPVCYDVPANLDLEELAEKKNRCPDELIAAHLEAEYRVYMIGFAPGFAYLGGLPEILHTPRREVPRQYIEAGSLGIGGKQASINSVAGPSGWWFIGRTPLKLFDAERAEPVLMWAGDTVKFERIDADECRRLDALQAEGKTIVEPIIL